MLIEYLNNFNNYLINVVYDFNLGDGGFADCIKFYLYLLNICIDKKYKLYYIVNNIKLEKYIGLKNDMMYISKDQIEGKTKNINYNDLLKLDKNNSIDLKYYKITPGRLYKTFLYNKVNIKGEDVFHFSTEVIENSKNLLGLHNNYISLHLRLGDKFLETEKKYVLCKDDKRNYNLKDLHKFIEDNKDKNIIFLCDNHEFKLKIKEQFPFIVILDSEIGHTSFTNTSDKQVLDTLTEFYIMSNSSRIVSSSASGFPILASYFKKIPITFLYDTKKEKKKAYRDL